MPESLSFESSSLVAGSACRPARMFPIAYESANARGRRQGEWDAMDERAYVAENTRELERMRTLADGLSEQNLRLPVNEFWTVAGVFGHIAFWDARILALADKFERGEPFTESDHEPEDVDWINDASRPLIHAVPPAELVRLSLRIAQETDERVAALPPDRMWPNDPDSPIYCVRAAHRGEHLDDVEAALGAR